MERSILRAIPAPLPSAPPQSDGGGPRGSGGNYLYCDTAVVVGRATHLTGAVLVAGSVAVVDPEQPVCGVPARGNEAAGQHIDGFRSGGDGFSRGPQPAAPVVVDVQVSFAPTGSAATVGAFPLVAARLGCVLAQ